MADPTTASPSLAAEPVGGRLRFLGYGACALAGALWGTGFYWGRLALNEMNVEHMVLYRFLFACVGMAPVIVMRRVRLTATETRAMLLAAFLFVPLQFLLQFHGLAQTTVSHASLMVGAMPVLLAATAVMFAGEHLDGLSWLALCASTVGAAMVVLGGNHATTGRETPTLQGDLLVVASLVSALGWILTHQEADEDAQSARRHGVHDLFGHCDAVDLDQRVVGGGKAGAPKNRSHAVHPCEHHRMDGTGNQRAAVHGVNYASLELGHSSRAGFPRRCVP